MGRESTGLVAPGARVASRPVGGQAVCEGVMMRGEDRWAVAVRRADGRVETRVEDVPPWCGRFERVPVVRGVAALAESFTIGVRGLTWSVERASADAGQPVTLPSLARTVALALGVVLTGFVIFPAALGRLAGGSHGLVVTAVEGAVRLAILLTYLVAIGRRADVRRLFAYHGAEHRAVATYEAGAPLTPEAARAFGTRHLRCGTTFLLLVVVVAVVVHSLAGAPGWGVLFASRLVAVPVVAGLAYELLRAAARGAERWPVVWVLMAPGLALQALTTREPDDGQVEVALAALSAVLPPAGVTAPSRESEPAPRRAERRARS
ncbi:MAG TPA: DUF1385 domain-containing protein [Acidimicrobiales bacterium]